ncbi:hypothetical protein BGX29_000090 [Mortierella sp. GBA35]|nr:hypothetical protein BGX29_000090 [Mortierella sp. GBA35]
MSNVTNTTNTTTNFCLQLFKADNTTTFLQYTTRDKCVIARRASKNTSHFCNGAHDGTGKKFLGLSSDLYFYKFQPCDDEKYLEKAPVTQKPSGSGASATLSWGGLEVLVFVASTMIVACKKIKIAGSFR